MIQFLKSRGVVVWFATEGNVEHRLVVSPRFSPRHGCDN